MRRVERRITELERQARPARSIRADWYRTLSLVELRFLRDVAHRQRNGSDSSLIKMEADEQAQWEQLESKYSAWAKTNGVQP